ncbi:AraC family transcriptional regulator [Paenibacillus sp. 32352]|uniref:helix-turn-helix domain-containing protein n=1 Tax=Paenibacillus sp. 32352 TaxID=1969111 RepID=UPI0009ABCFEF|nr:AraC family transcriptional regulator [Paenibacillus sp. 32352]
MSNRHTPSKAIQGLERLLGDLLASPYIFRILASYNVSVKTDWMIRERVLNEFHMLYVVSGSGTYIVEDTAVDLSHNHVLFISNQVRHRAFRNQDIPFRIIPTRFQLYSPAEEQLIAYNAEPFYLHFSPGNAFAMQQLFEKVHTYNQLPASVIKDTLCHSAVAETLAGMLQELKAPNQPLSLHPGLLRLKQVMDEQPAERLSLSQMAEVACLSPKYVSALFRQAFGMSVKEYQIRTRMDYAEYLLKHSDQTVKQLSVLLDYPDPYAFSKQFKQYRGYSPSSVRTTRLQENR